jgi:cleavage and polyadenylation specificity factor subunit 4
MPMQPQLGLVNPQIPITFNNSNTLLSNGQAMANMPPLIAQQPGILSGPNDLAILQLQNQVNKLNALKMLMDQVNQLQGELFGPSFSNLPQQLNQNMGLLQNPMQNMMNPVMPLQMPINSQVGSFNVPSSNHQVVGAQSQNFFVNPPFGAEQRVNPNQPNYVMPTTSAYGSKLLHVADQQVQGKWSASQQGQSFLMPTVGANGPNVANQQVEGNSPALQQSEKVPMPAMAANGAKPLPIATQQGQGNSSASQQSWNSQPSTYNRWQVTVFNLDDFFLSSYHLCNPVIMVCFMHFPCFSMLSFMVAGTFFKLLH